MEAAALRPPDPAGVQLSFDSCACLDGEQGQRTAFARLEAVVGSELAHQLVSALVSSR